MAANPVLLALFQSLFPDTGSTDITPENVRTALEALAAAAAPEGGEEGQTLAKVADGDTDYATEWVDPGGSGSSGVSSFNTRTGAVTPASGDYTGAQITQDSTHRFVTDAEKATWNAGGALEGTSTTFNGTVKFDKILGRYATVNSSDISGAITVDAAGAVPLGCYYLIVVEDGGGEPTFTGFKFADSSEAYDTTDGNSTLYMFQNVGGTYHAGILQQGVAVAVNQAPTATPVTISGTAQEGQTLTGSHTYADNESDPAGTPVRQWYKADDTSGTNRAAISGATNGTYIVQTADVGKYIQYGVIATATSGTTPGAEGLSSYTSIVLAIGANQAPVASSVTISGTAKVGQLLTGSYTYSDNESDAEGASVKQWYRADNGSGLNRAAISGATNATYTVLIGDLGKFLQFEVTPAAATGTSPGSAAVSSYTSAVLENVAPTLSSIAVETATPDVVDFLFNEALAAGHVPLASDFTVSGHTTTGTVTITGSTVHVPVTVAFTNGEAARTGAYTPGLTANKLQDAAGNLVAAFSGQTITNNVSAGGLTDLAYPTQTSGITESPAHTFNIPSGGHMVDDLVSMAGDGEAEMEITSTTNEFFFGLDTSSTNNSVYAGAYVWSYAIVVYSGHYYITTGGSAVDLGFAPNVGDKIKFSVVSGVVKFRLDTGSGYTDQYTWGPTVSGPLYSKAEAGSTSAVIKNPKGAGFA